MRESAVACAVTTCPQFVTFNGRFAEWDDTTTPRTDKPVRFDFAYDRHNGYKLETWTIRPLFA